MDQISLPKLGQTMENAVIEKWHVKEGDLINKGDVVVEITTDKATLEVESFVAGTVRKILAEEGEEKDVASIIALVGDPGEEIPDISTLQSAAPTAKSETASSAPSTPQKKASATSAKPGRVRATPRAKKLAKELGVDLSTVKGTGPGGRITEDDVKAGGGAAPAGTAMVEDVEKKPLSAMRRVIAENMTKSSQEAPHFYLNIEVDMTDAVALREKLKSESGVSYNDMIVKACATALAEMPDVNATWMGDGIGRRKSVDIGLAVSVEDGLMVPVIRDADKKALSSIAKESADLIERTRSKKLTPDEYGNGSMTVSNLGMLGIDSFIPVINLGESVIMGVGRILEKPVAVEGRVEVRRMMTLTLSCDHRVVDGTLGGQFLGRVRELLGKPGEL